MKSKEIKLGAIQIQAEGGKSGKYIPEGVLTYILHMMDVGNGQQIPESTTWSISTPWKAQIPDDGNPKMMTSGPYSGKVLLISQNGESMEWKGTGELAGFDVEREFNVKF